MEKAPPPPEVGEKFWGPRVSDRAKRATYEVRAVVDPEPEEHPEYGWFYWVVFRYWNPRKGGHRYLIDSSFALALSYIPKRKRRPTTTAS